jgi:orotate phosphoribosyltransferase
LKEALKVFKQTGALKQGHFRLTSGLHSATYFQCALVLQFPEHCAYLARHIVDYFKDRQIDVVVAPAIGGIVIGQEVARQLNCRIIFCEREDGQMKLRRGFSISPGENVLVCEDVVTTGGSVFEVIGVVKNNQANLVGVGFIVDRSGGKVNFDTDQYAVVKMKVETFSEKECPLCKQEIAIDKPGSRT